ncbi:MAG: hypothetical protein KAY65_04300 [Planctomycetes bacterium]|nr:hypothetical protein [Planctomycetota bacterium]
MKRRDFIKLSGAAVAGLEASRVLQDRKVRAGDKPGKSGKPNILMITCHDIGRHIGCYGVETVRTPNLDRLAAKGVRFANPPERSPAHHLVEGFSTRLSRYRVA